jgi:hypothetical protein
MPASVSRGPVAIRSLSRHDILVNVSARRDPTRPRRHDDFSLSRFSALKDTVVRVVIHGLFQLLPKNIAMQKAPTGRQR